MQGAQELNPTGPACAPTLGLLCTQQLGWWKAFDGKLWVFSGKTEKNLCALTSGAPGAGVGVGGYHSPLLSLQGISPLSSTAQVQTFSSNAFKLRLS